MKKQIIFFNCQFVLCAKWFVGTLQVCCLKKRNFYFLHLNWAHNVG